MRSRAIADRAYVAALLVGLALTFSTPADAQRVPTDPRVTVVGIGPAEPVAHQAAARAVHAVLDSLTAARRLYFVDIARTEQALRSSGFRESLTAESDLYLLAAHQGSIVAIAITASTVANGVRLQPTIMHTSPQQRSDRPAVEAPDLARAAHALARQLAADTTVLPPR